MLTRSLWEQRIEATAIRSPKPRGAASGRPYQPRRKSAPWLRDLSTRPASRWRRACSTDLLLSQARQRCGRGWVRAAPSLTATAVLDPVTPRRGTGPSEMEASTTAPPSPDLSHSAAPALRRKHTQSLGCPLGGRGCHFSLSLVRALRVNVTTRLRAMEASLFARGRPQTTGSRQSAPGRSRTFSPRNLTSPESYVLVLFQ